MLTVFDQYNNKHLQKFQSEVFWVMTPCSVAVGPCASTQPRGPRLESSPL